VKATWISGGVLVVALLALALFFGLRGSETEDVAVPVDVLAPAADEIVLERTEVIPEAEDEPAVVADVETATEAEPVERTSRAVFDIVRVEPDGETVIAGRADANSTLTLLLDGAEAGQAGADGGGSFVALLSLGTADVPRVLTLLERFLDGSEAFADQSVILAPSPKVIVAEVEDAGEVVADELAAASAGVENGDAATLVEDAGEVVADELAAASAGVENGASKMAMRPLWLRMQAKSLQTSSLLRLLASKMAMRPLWLRMQANSLQMSSLLRLLASRIAMRPLWSRMRPRQ
jgi:hypothetical protein